MTALGVVQVIVRRQLFGDRLRRLARRYRREARRAFSARERCEMLDAADLATEIANEVGEQPVALASQDLPATRYFQADEHE